MCRYYECINVISDRESGSVPQEAQPGLVTLRTPNGDTTTELTLHRTYFYRKLYTGYNYCLSDELTIEGREYLNLIHEIIFTDDVTVTEDLLRMNGMIKLLVPEEAQTEQIILSDGRLPNLIYSEDLVVTLPSVNTGL